MSHNKISVSGVDPNSSGEIALNITDLTTDTPVTNDTLVGTAGGDIEFGTLSTDYAISQYFYVNDTSTQAGQRVTANGYVTQFLDNRFAEETEINSGIDSIARGCDGVNYGGGSSRLHSQLLLDAGTYFLEFNVHPAWSSSGTSQIQWRAGNNSSTAVVRGNLSYCASNSPSRNFLAIATSTATDSRVCPEIQANTNQTIGAGVPRGQSMFSIRIK
jgi:hypothetical protein